MINLLIGLSLVVSSLGAGLSKINSTKNYVRAPRKHVRPLIIDKEIL